MRVKICGITRAQDMRDAIAAGADAVGLVFDHGSRKLALPQAAELLREARACDPAVQTIAVVGAVQGPALRAIAALDFDGVQFDARCPWPGKDLRGCYPVPAFFDSPDLERRVAAYAADHPLATPAPADAGPAGSARDGHSMRGLVNLDAAAGGGTGELSNWARAAAVCARVPSLIAGGLTPDNVGAAIERTAPDGVDVCSGVEASPGIKDADRMRRFVTAARARTRAR